MNIDYERPPLYDYQKAILNSNARYTVTEASTKSGKTASHIIWLFEQAIQLKANQNCWWIAPVYATAEMAFNRMKAQVSDKKFFKVNESKLKLTTPTGSVITFKSAEKPDNLYGDDVYACVFDEFTRAREEAWFALRSTLTATNGTCKFIGNVKGKKNWGYRLAQRAKAGEEGFQYFKITAYDAVDCGLLKMEEIEQAKRDLPEHVFKELYLAEPSEDGSNPFGYQHIKNCITPLSTKEPVCFGIDLAKSFDYTVIIGLDVDGNVCYQDRFQKDWKQTKETIVAKVGRAPALIDSTGVGDAIVEDLQGTCPAIEGFKFSSNSKQQIMEGLATAIQQRLIGYPDGVVVSELEQFEFEYGSTGVKYSAPQGLHDDTVCALALARKKYIEKSRQGNYVVV